MATGILHSMSYATKVLCAKMGTACFCVDCCFGLRKYNQCCFPCITWCGYSRKKIFYNYDGTEIVEPLVDYFKPSNKEIKGNLVSGMELSAEEAATSRGPADQIALVLRYASERSLRCRAVGTGSSWSKLTNTRDILIDMTNLDKIIRADSQNDENSIYHIEVQGGKRVSDFVKEIDYKYGMGFPAMGNYAGQTVAGICSTSTHGSSFHAQTMSNFAVAFHLIIAEGIEIKVRRPREKEQDESFEFVRERVQSATFGQAPIEIVSNDIFQAVAVSLGCMGVIYSVTFECIATYDIVERRISANIDWPAEAEDPIGKFRLPDDFAEKYTGEGSFFSFFVNPFPRKDSKGQSFLKSVYLDGKKVDSSPRCTYCSCCLDLQCLCCFPGCRGKAACQLVQTDCSATLLQMWASCFPSCVPGITDFGLNNFKRTLPYIHKWYNVLTFTNGNIHVKTAEYCVPLPRLNEVLADVISLAQEYGKKHHTYSLLPIYCRIAKSDDLYMSPAYHLNPEGNEKFEHYCYIEIPFLPGAYGVSEYHKAMEDHLFKKYKARPHWSKNNFINANRIQSLYPHLDKWKRVYLLFNHDQTFDNEFTDNCGFDAYHDEEESPKGTPEAVVDRESAGAGAGAGVGANAAVVSQPVAGPSAFPLKGNEVVTEQPTSSKTNINTID